MSAFRAITTDIRDRIQSPRINISVPSINRFAWDPSADVVEDPNGPFAALGYAKSPVYKKAAPAPLPPALQYAVWGLGFADYEDRTQTFFGADVGRTTRTYGGIGGVDAAFSNFLGTGGTYVVGLLGGYTSSNVRNADGSTARVQGPGGGFYTVYVNGAFSTDSVTKIDVFDLNRTALFAATPKFELTSVTSSYNLNYKFTAGTWWIEPTVGGAYTRTYWDSIAKGFGMQNGETLRIQGGVRFGTVWNWGGVTVEHTLTGLAYNDVYVKGGTLAVAVGTPLVPTDENKVFGQGIAKFNFLWTPQFSSFIEGEVRGRPDVLGYAGRGGLRYSF